MKIKKADQEEVIKLADELLHAAVKVVGNEADRSLHQHISTLYTAAMAYNSKRYSGCIT